MRISRIIILAALLFACCSLTAHAQDYKFEIPSATVTLTVEKEGTLLVEYTITFHNVSQKPIDIVDVGMPNKHYEVLSASIDGRALSGWRPSKYIACGPEVPLSGRSAIAYDETKVFTCRARVQGMIFSDSKSKERASLRFTPTWFGEKYVQGETNLLLIVKFPDGVHPDDVVWHKGMPEFSRKGLLEPDNAVFAAWAITYPMTGPKMFGLSFPRNVVANVRWGGWLRQWLTLWENSRNAQIISGILFVLVFTAVYMYITRGTGVAPLLALVGILIFIFWKYPMLHLAAWGLPPLMLVLRWFAARHKRTHYLPALARVERGSICRVLTPLEAAIVMERPLSQVIELVMTDFLDKGILEVSEASPLTVKRAGKRFKDNLIETPDGRRITLLPWEIAFYNVFISEPVAVESKDFSEALRRLVGVVHMKLEGFDLDATREYYKGVGLRARQKVDEQPDDEKKAEVAQRNRGWFYTDDDGDDYLYGRRGYYHHPRWWRHHHTGWRAPFRESTARAAERLPQPAPPKVDLSKVDKFTGDALGKLLTSTGGGRGGRGGGCACAGCACACACAGGGR